MRKTLVVLAIALALPLLSGCTDEAENVSKNLSTAANNFEVNRRIVVFSTGFNPPTYLMEIEGACAIFDQGKQLEIICKNGPHSYSKHMAGLSMNTSYFVEQGAPVQASAYHTRITFMPQSIIPDPDFRGSTSPEDLPQSQP